MLGKLKAAVLFLFVSACLCSAQTYYHHHEFNRFNFGGGGGVTVPTERAGDILNTGWNINARGGYNVHPNVALDLDFTYQRSRLNDATLAAFGEPDGHMSTWSFTFNPVVKLATRHQALQPYITAGYGVYGRNLTLTAPVLVNGFVCDPFFGFCYPATFGVNQTVASNTTYKGGWNAGGGFDIGHGNGLKFFVEARYHRMFTSHGPDFTLVPVTFGVHF